MRRLSFAAVLPTMLAAQGATEVVVRHVTATSTPHTETFHYVSAFGTLFADHLHAYQTTFRIPTFDTLGGTRQLQGVSLDVTLLGSISASFLGNEPSMRYRNWLFAGLINGSSVTTTVVFPGSTGTSLKLSPVDFEYIYPPPIDGWLGPTVPVVYAPHYSYAAHRVGSQLDVARMLKAPGSEEVDMVFLATLLWEVGAWVPNATSFQSPSWGPASSSIEASARITYHFTGAQSPWTDMGKGSSGIQGTPLLRVEGTPDQGQPVSWITTHAAPSSVGMMLASFGEASTLWFGETLVPDPSQAILVPFATDSQGDWSHHSSWPPGVPDRQLLYFQCIVYDPSTDDGLSATNAVRGVTQ